MNDDRKLEEAGGNAPESVVSQEKKTELPAGAEATPDGAEPAKGAERRKGRPTGRRPAGPPRPPRPKVPPEVFAKAKQIAEKSGIPVGWAIPVAQGEKTLSEQLLRLRLRDQVNALQAQGALTPRYASEVLKGNLDIERAKAESRLIAMKHQEVYYKCHFQDFAEQGQSVGVALVGKRLLYGTVTLNDKYAIKLKSGEEELLLDKHDMKFYFAAGDKKQVLKQVTWGDKETVLEQSHLKRLKHRVDIKARVYLDAKEQDKAITWQTVENDVLRGKVVFLGRWEVVLETAKGVKVVMLRHAVKAVT